MELYYFIEKNGTKQGPYKLFELKQQTIYFNELIWRSDSDHWKKASEFEELNDVVIIIPPPTPKEQKIAEVNQNFTEQIIGGLTILYIITSLLIGFISHSIAIESWEKHLKNAGSKYLGSNSISRTENYGNISMSRTIGGGLNDGSTKSDTSMSSLQRLQALAMSGDPGDGRITGGGIPRSLAEVTSNRYSYFMPGNYNNEDAYGRGQNFWFRPFKAFGSTIYLTLEEQKNSNLLMGHLILSSFASISFIFMIIGILYYAIKRNDLADKLANTEDNN